MTDFSAQFANRFESSLTEQNQPATEIVNARLQRIEELERLRQERLASHPTANNNSDASSRLQRRDRFIRQATQTRSMERRSFASNIQRTPVVRSQTLETSPSLSASNDETSSFREMFESTRQNLFGPRISASSENLSSFHRSASDTRLMPGRSHAVPEQPDSGSSTPRSNQRPSWDIASGLAEAFSSVRSSLHIGSDSNLVSREVARNTATTREARNPSTNYQRFMMSNPTSTSTPTTSSVLTRSASVRESRRETGRFRRRTIQGVDNNVSQALERGRVAVEAQSSLTTRSNSRSHSATRTQSRQAVAQSSTATVTERDIQETHTEASSYSASSTVSSFTNGYTNNSSYNGTRSRSVELFPEDSVPVLGLEDEKVKFIDAQGQCHWLSKHHQLLRMIKNTNTVPEIVMKGKLETKSTEPDGFIATIEESSDNRYKQLRELVQIARKRDAIEYNGDIGDWKPGMSLVELYERGDFMVEEQQGTECDIDKKFKNLSLYTLPRARPDLEEYLSTRVFAPLYDSIQRPDLESETQTESESTQQTEFPRRGPVQYRLSAACMAGMQYSTSSSATINGARVTSEEHGSQQRRQAYSYTADTDGAYQSTSYSSAEQSSYSREYSSQYDGDQEEAVPDIDTIDTSEIPSEVNLVMERLHMMQAATGGGNEIDASHLDYDEMLMIQQALADNPSPPDTPDSMLSPRMDEWPAEFEPEVSPHSYNTPTSMPESLISPSVFSHTNSAPSGFSRSYDGPVVTSASYTSTQQTSHTVQASSSTSLSSNGAQRTEQSVSKSVSQTMSASTSSSNNSTNISSQKTFSATEHVTNTSVASQNNTANVNQPESSAASASVPDTRGTGASPYPSRVSASPRLSRISSSGSESMLPLPSMDFSPLERSPQRSPQRFNFSETDTSALDRTSDTSRTTTVDNGPQPSPSTSRNLQSELTIEIPGSSNEGQVASADRRDSYKSENGGTTPKTTASPLAKSGSSSVNGSGAASPTDGDTVTTVFEEFVQTIPKGLLSDWNSSHNDNR